MGVACHGFSADAFYFLSHEVLSLVPVRLSLPQRELHAV